MVGRGVGALGVALVLGCASGEGSRDPSDATGTGGASSSGGSSGSSGGSSGTGGGTSSSSGETPTSTGTSGAPVLDTSTSSGEASSSSSSGETSSGDGSSSGGSSSGEGPGSSGAPEPVCGDGQVDDPELCDDGDDVDGNGCNVDCVPSGQLLWSTTHAGMLGFTDEGLGCDVDGTGSIYVVGLTALSAADEDLWLRKYAAGGEALWTQTYAGSAKLKDQGRGVVVDAAELVYAAGFANVLEQSNNSVVRKYAADGMPVWTKSFNGVASLGDIASAVVQTKTGDVLVGGATGVTDAGNDTWLRKYSAAGAVLWTRYYAGAGKGHDETNALAVTDDGGYFYAAGIESVVGEGRNLWLAKYDIDGNLLWSRLYNGAASKDDHLYAAVAMADGGVVVCGYETSVGIPWSSFLRRYDANGLVVWTEVDAGPEELGALCYGLDRAGNGDILLAGAAIAGTTREPRLRRLAPDGTPLWSTVVVGAGKGSSQARCVREAPDGTVVAVGGQDEGTDGRDAWVARFTP